MNRFVLSGALLAVAGLVGYVVGVQVPYPGRAFSLTAIMVGVSLLALGGWTRGGRVDRA